MIGTLQEKQMRRRKKNEKHLWNHKYLCKKIEMNFRDKEPTKELNKFLQENNGNIIDIQYIGELYGIADAIVTYKEEK